MAAPSADFLVCYGYYIPQIPFPAPGHAAVPDGSPASDAAETEEGGKKNGKKDGKESGKKDSAEFYVW